MVPANERATQGQKGVINVDAALRARARPTYLVQLLNRALYHPTLFSQAGIMSRATTGETRPLMQGSQPA